MNVHVISFIDEYLINRSFSCPLFMLLELFLLILTFVLSESESSVLTRLSCWRSMPVCVDFWEPVCMYSRHEVFHSLLIKRCCVICQKKMLCVGVMMAECWFTCTLTVDFGEVKCLRKAFFFFFKFVVFILLLFLVYSKHQIFTENFPVVRILALLICVSHQTWW